MKKLEESGWKGTEVERIIGIANKQKNQIKVQSLLMPVVEIDVLMESLLEYFSTNKTTNKELNKMFAAGDFDNDGMIGYYEFMCLCKYVDNIGGADKSRAIEIEKLFFQKCDLVSQDSGERNLSSNAFVSLATQADLFRREKIELFVKEDLTSAEHAGITNFEKLKERKEEVLTQLKMRFFKTASFNPFLASAIRKLSDSISDPTKEQAAWITYRILDLESKHLLFNSELQDCLPDEFLHILRKAKE